MLIAGPTSSGKSALAVALARRFGGTVINCDSMQVYRDLAIITARPDAEEEAQAPHRLFGHVDGSVNHSVGQYVRDAVAALGESGREGRLPILVGGTGLYFKALTDGLSEIPPVPEAVRDAFRARAANLSSAELHAELGTRDPAMAARLRPNDRLRVMRALEATGRSLADFQGTRVPGPLARTGLARLFLDPEREQLRARIDARFLAMMRAGALDEVAALRARRLDPMLPVMRAHGVPALIAHLDGTLPLAEAVARGQADTRAYAKRQVTWFRHQMAGWQPLDPSDAGEAASRAVEALLVRPPGASHPTG